MLPHKIRREREVRITDQVQLRVKIKIQADIPRLVSSRYLNYQPGCTDHPWDDTSTVSSSLVHCLARQPAIVYDARDLALILSPFLVLVPILVLTLALVAFYRFTVPSRTDNAYHVLWHATRKIADSISGSDESLRNDSLARARARAHVMQATGIKVTKWMSFTASALEEAEAIL